MYIMRDNCAYVQVDIVLYAPLEWYIFVHATVQANTELIETFEINPRVIWGDVCAKHCHKKQ